MSELGHNRREEEEGPQPDAGAGEPSAHPAGPDHDPIRHPAPPGNPDADEEAVAKGEENLGRVSGR
jgi:hypothetical protein